MNAPIVIHSAPQLLLRAEAERLRALFGADVVIHDWQGVPLRGATLAITHREVTSGSRVAEVARA